MNIQLLLEDQIVELSKDVVVPLNKTYSMLENPTDIIVDYSKTIKIPITSKNNEVLGHAYRIDKLVLSNPDSNIGIYLDPTKKIPFKLLYNNSLVLEGYAKFASANNGFSSNYYTMNLYGSLGGIFNELNNVVTNKEYLSDPNDTKYLLDDLMTDEPLNADYVARCWNKDDHDLTDISSGAGHGVANTDIIGFAPAHRGQYSNFENDKIEVVISRAGSTDIFSMEEALHNKWLLTANSILGDIPPEEVKQYVDDLKPGEVVEGMTDYKMREYRSRYLKPYIYIDKLFQMFKKKCKDLTDYDMILDPAWFNNSNPYWTKMCYMLNYFEREVGSVVQGGSSGGEGTYTFDKKGTGSKYEYVEFEVETGQSNIAGDIVINPFKCKFIQPYSVTNNNYQVFEGRANPTLFLGVYIDIYSDVELVGSVKRFTRPNYVAPWGMFKNDNAEYAPPGFIQSEYFKGDVFECNSNITSQTASAELVYDFTVPEIKYRGIVPGKLKLKYKFQWVCPGGEWFDYGPFVWSAQYQTGGIYDKLWYSSITPEASLEVLSPISTGVSSDTSLSVVNVRLSTFYKSEEPIFKVLLQYTKMFGLIWDIDYANRSVIISTKDTYFNNATTIDWTDKIDRTKDFIVTPISFNSKYVNFNYEEVDGHNYSDYNKKYGVQYGAKKLYTGYDFDSESTDLFEGIYPSIVSTKQYVRYCDLIDWNLSGQIPVVSEPTAMIDDDNEDETQCLSLNNWYFRNEGVDNTNLPINQRIRITDDSELQKATGIICWTDTSALRNTVFPDKFPSFHVVSGENGLLFNKPMLDYTEDKKMSNAKFIYDNFWSKYIDERYSIQNKMLTAYVKITPEDYINIKMNHNYIIDNQLFLINRIFDYDLNGDGITKVEFVQISRPGAYTTSGYATGSPTQECVIKVSATPADAIITINGQEIGNSNPEATSSLSKDYNTYVGEYITIKVMKEGYTTYNNIYMVTGNETITVNLESRMYNISFKPDVDATITVEKPDGEIVKLEGLIYRGPLNELIKWKAVSTELGTLEGVHLIVADATIPITFKESKKKITFESNVENYELTVNSISVPDKVYMAFSGEIISYKATADGYETLEGMLQVFEDETIQLFFGGQKYTVTFESNVPKTTYNVNKKNITGNTYTATVGTRLLVTANAPGYKPLTKNITIKGNQTVNFDFNNISEGVFLVTWRADVDNFNVKVNGSYIAGNTYEAQPNESITYEVTSPGYNAITGSTIVTSDMVIDVNFNKTRYDITFDVDDIRAVVYINNRPLPASLNGTPGRVYSGYKGETFSYRVVSQNYSDITGNHTIEGNATIEINFFTETCNVTFRSNVKNTRIDINGIVKMEDMPFTLRKGKTYKYKAWTYEQYNVIEAEFVVTGDMTIDLEFESAEYAITFVVDDEDATIKVNGNVLEGNVYYGHYMETIDIEVSAPYKDTFTLRWLIVASDTLYITLRGTYKIIYFDVDITGYTLLVNGSPLYVKDRYLGVQGDLITYEVSHPDYQTITGTHFIEEETTIFIDFKPRIKVSFEVEPPKDQLENFVLTCSELSRPSGNDVVTDITDTLYYMNRVGKQLNYSASADLYRDVNKYIVPTEDCTVKIVMEPLTYDLAFNINGGVNTWLKINGELVDLPPSQFYYYTIKPNETVRWEAGADGCDTMSGVEVYSEEQALIGTKKINITLVASSCLTTWIVDVDDYTVHVGKLPDWVEPIEGNSLATHYGQVFYWKVTAPGYDPIVSDGYHEVLKTNDNIRVQFIDPKFYITFNVIPNDAKITASSGTWVEPNVLEGKKGTYADITVSKPNYQDYKIRVYFDKDQTLDIVLSERLYTITFKPTVYTPCLLYINGELHQGNNLFNMTYKGSLGEKFTWKVVPKDSIYPEVSGEHIIVDDEVIVVDIQRNIEVTFITDPEDARLIVEGVDCSGPNPKKYTGPAYYVINWDCSKLGYISQRGTVYLEEDTSVNIKLEKRFIGVEFVVRSSQNVALNNIKITVNNEPLELNESNRYIYEGVEGETINYTVSADGHAEEVGTYVISDANVIIVQLQLTQGTFKFDCRPYDLDLKVDGVLIEPPTPDSRFRYYTGEIGQTITVEASRTGYITQTENYTFRYYENTIPIILSGDYLYVFFSFDVPGASLWVNGEELPGKMVRAVEGDVIEYTAKADGYEDITGSYYVTAENAEGKDIHVRVNFLPTVLITFSSNVLEYDVYVDNVLIEGHFYYASQNSAYNIKYIKQGYDPVGEYVQVGTEPMDVYLEMNRTRYQKMFVINPDVSGVVIKVDGVVVDRYIRLSGYWGDTYEYEVSCPGFKTVSGTVRMENSGDIYINLVPDSVTLSFDITPSDSDLYINEEFVVGREFNVKRGFVANYRIVAEGYGTYEDTVRVDNDTHLVYDLTSSKVNVNFNFTNEDINANSGYEIFVNGKKIESLNYQCERGETLSIVVNCVGFETYSDEFVVNGYMRYDITMIEKYYTITFDVNDVDFGLYINDNPIGSYYVPNAPNGHVVVEYEAREGVKLNWKIQPYNVSFNPEIHTGTVDVTRDITILVPLKEAIKFVFNVTPSDATIIVGDQTLSGNVYYLSKGSTINYTVMRDGYVTQRGTLDGNTSSSTVNINITLSSDDVYITFETQLDEFELWVGPKFIGTASNGSITYKPDYGDTVMYLLKAEGYNDIEGTVFANSSRTIKLNFELTTYTITIITNPSSAVIKNTDTGGYIGKQFIGAPGSVLNYEASATGYITRTGTITIGNESRTVTIVLGRSDLTYKCLISVPQSQMSEIIGYDESMYILPYDPTSQGYYKIYSGQDIYDTQTLYYKDLLGRTVRVGSVPKQTPVITPYKFDSSYTTARIDFILNEETTCRIKYRINGGYLRNLYDGILTIWCNLNDEIYFEIYQYGSTEFTYTGTVTADTAIKQVIPRYEQN